MAREARANPGKHDTVDSTEAPREIDSRTLFGEARVLTIRHGGEIYTLRITRAEKLILTK